MKLSVTDEFLWDLYNTLDATGNILRYIFFPPRTFNQMSVRIDDMFLRNGKYKNRAQFAKLIYHLKTKGYIKVKALQGKRAIIITKNGIEKTLKTSFKIEKKQKRKDGKWIMLIFDMPARYKKSRDILRSILLNLGYKMFQQSVWITPYDVSDKTEKLLQYYSLEKYVKIFIIEEIN